MNEVLASAIGNGVFMQKHLTEDQYRVYAQRPGSFYQDPIVDRAAKAALPLVRETLVANGTLDRAFFDRYFVTMQRTLGEELASPKVALRTSQIYVTAPALEPVATRMARQYGLQSTYTNVWNAATYTQTAGYRYRNLPVAILSRESDSLDAARSLLGKHASRLSSPLATCKARRESAGWVFVFTVPEGRSDIDLEIAIPDCPGAGQ